MTVGVTIFNAFVPPANIVAAPVPGGSAPANESTFGGETNQAPSDSQSTTITESRAQASFASMRLQASGSKFTSGNRSANLPTANPKVLWGAAASALLDATLAEWQRRREEEAARLAAMRNNRGGGDEEEEQGNGRKSAGQIAYEKKQQQKRIVAESQALMDHRKAQEQTQNAAVKNKNLTAAEAEMDKVKPVTPYVAASYIDKDEEKRLKGRESQRAWAAVQSQQQAKQEHLNDVYAAWWAGVASVGQTKQESEKKSEGWLSNLWNAGISAMGTIASPLKNIYSNNNDDPTIGETLVPRPSRWTVYYLPEQAAMKTYLAASINVQSEGVNVDEEDRNSHLGYAQLSRNELDTPYKQGFDDNGDLCKNDCRGYGLGLPGEDPYDNETAVRGMDRRVQQVLDRAEKLSEDNNIALTTTDKYIIAAMAQNGPGFDFNDINRVMMDPGYEGFIVNGRINWEAYFETKQTEWKNRVRDAWKNPFDPANAETIVNNVRTGGAGYDTQFMLEKFYEETSALQTEGYYLPNDLDITRIEGLINQPAGTGGGQ